MILAIHTLPFTSVKPTHPTTFIYFYLKQAFDINRWNKLFTFYLSHWNNWKSMENTNTVMGTMEHYITVFGPQQHYNHHNSNNIPPRQPQPGSKCSSECLGCLRVKGYTDLIAPKYPLIGDQLMSYQFYNLPTTKININLHIQKDTS